MSKSAAHVSSDPESVALLPWVPLTTAALSLRLFEFDSSINYVKLEKLEPVEEKEATEYIVSFIFLCYLVLSIWVADLKFSS